MLDLKKYGKQSKAYHFQQKLNCYDKIPDDSLALVKWPKFPDNFLIWRNLSFSPDLSLTRSKPDDEPGYTCITNVRSGFRSNSSLVSSDF